MSYAFPPDIARIIEAQMQTGLYASEDEVLRVALHSFSEQEAQDGEFPDDTIAIQEALDDLDNGDEGQPLDEVIAELRLKHGLPNHQ